MTQTTGPEWRPDAGARARSCWADRKLTGFRTSGPVQPAGRWEAPRMAATWESTGVCHRKGSGAMSGQADRGRETMGSPEPAEQETDVMGGAEQIGRAT